MTSLDKLKAHAAAKYGATFRRKRSSWLMWCGYILLQVATLGRFGRFWRFTTTLGTTIYLAPRVSAATMAHEIVHLWQREQMGPARYVWRYITRRGRLEIEAEAYAMSAFMRRLQGQPPSDRAVDHLTGPMYLWPSRDRLAVAELIEASHNHDLEREIREVLEHRG